MFKLRSCYASADTQKGTFCLKHTYCMYTPPPVVISPAGEELTESSPQECSSLFHQNEVWQQMLKHSANNYWSWAMHRFQTQNSVSPPANFVFFFPPSHVTVLVCKRLSSKNMFWINKVRVCGEAKSTGEMMSKICPQLWKYQYAQRCTTSARARVLL